MESVVRRWRIGVGLCGIAMAVLAVVVWGFRPTPAPPPVSTGPAGRDVTLAVELDLDRLYLVDHLVLEGDPQLDLLDLAPVGAGPPGPPVPEPAASTLWILGFAALYTLYLPSRSW